MDQNMIHTLLSKAAHEPFANSIRLRRSTRRYGVFNSLMHVFTTIAKKRVAYSRFSVHDYEFGLELFMFMGRSSLVELHIAPSLPMS
jgi:hypothetical protein